jgi:hypothetical protein
MSFDSSMTSVHEAIEFARGCGSGAKQLVSCYTISPMDEVNEDNSGADRLRSHLAASLREPLAFMGRAPEKSPVHWRSIGQKRLPHASFPDTQ